jgi:hypothetical protein
LYWPALSIGFLSDDFVLIERASDWNLGPVGPALFRPIPLFLWGVILRLGGASATIHLLNVVLHGTNAFLVVLLVQGWMAYRTWPMLAGFLFLVSPLAPEAVAWSSGLFDVLSTSFLLTLVLLARKYGDHPPAIRRCVTVIVGLAALMSKETAVIAPALLVLDGWVRRRLTRPVMVDAGILTFAFSLIAIQRLASAFGMTSPRVDRYAFQRGLFGSFGSLAVPWHVDIVRSVPSVPIIAAIALLAFVTVFSLRKASVERSRAAAAAVAWILVSVVPVWPIVGVMPDLQGSRYLYLPACGWAALLVVMAAPESDQRPKWHVLGTLCLGSLAALSAWGAWQHLQVWREAGRMRDTVERSAMFDERCRPILVSNLPDNVKGAYVFRNGAREAFKRDMNATVSVAGTGESRTGACSFRWNEKTLSFDRAQE